MSVMADGTDYFGKMVEVMEAVIIAFKGGHILEPWSEDEQCSMSASLEAAALWFPVLADRVTLHMYQAQALFQCDVLDPLLALGNAGSDQHITAHSC